MEFLSIDYMKQLLQYAIDYTLHDYDLHYITAMHERIASGGVNTIIVGPSYAQNGIEARYLEGGVERNVNLALSSQDLYYSFANIRRALDEGCGSVQQVIINIGYYALYHDLSKSKNEGKLINNIYLPLLGDAHHWENEEHKDEWLPDIEEEYYDNSFVVPFCRYWCRQYLLQEGGFYGAMVPRESINGLAASGVVWSEMNEDYHRMVAVKRCSSHNHLEKYSDTRAENIRLIKEETKKLVDAGIRVVYLICPFSKWYNQYIFSGFRTEIINLLEELDVPVELLDMNDYSDIFSDADFLDSDHLNAEGARKATALLNSFLQEEIG